jgi:hypothetical protein
MARKVVSEVLAEKVEEGYFSLEDAIRISEDILAENAWNHFKLDERWKR